MLTVYDWYNGPYPSRVRIAVAELKLVSSVRFTSVDLWLFPDVSVAPKAA